MSTHQETIQHTRAAINKCDDLVGALSGIDSMRSEIEGHIRAAFESTDVVAADQYYQLLSQKMTDALHAGQQLREYLEGALARFQSS